MPNRRERRAAARFGRRHGHTLDCGCSHLAISEAHGICDTCGARGSMVSPPMPTSREVGQWADCYWSCQCGGEFIGRSQVVEVL